MDTQKVDFTTALRLATKEREKYIKPITYNDKLRKKVLNKKIGQLINIHNFLSPVKMIINKLTQYKEGYNKFHDMLMQKLDLVLVNLTEDNINVEHCNDAVKLFKLIITNFPFDVWNNVNFYNDMDQGQYIFFAKFWSVFSQVLSTYEKVGQQKLLALTYKERVDLVNTVVDEDSLKGYIMSVGPVTPIDVVKTILEFHGLSYRFPDGVYAKEQFLRLFHDKNCSIGDVLKETEGKPLHRWITNNLKLIDKLYDVIVLSLCFNKPDIDIFINPITYCDVMKIKYKKFASYNGTKQMPLVAELEKPVKINGVTIVGLAVANVMLVDITDTTIFDNVKQFQKLYIGKIAIVCVLGVHTSYNFNNNDLIFLDRCSIKKNFSKNN